MRFVRIFLILFVPFIIQAQKVDVGILLGGSNYSGDLTLDSKSIIRQTRGCFGVKTTFSFDEYFGLGIQFQRLDVVADDQISNKQWQKNRNLNFKSKINSIDFIGSIQLSKMIYKGYTPLGISLIGGYSIFTFNPRGKINGVYFDLHDLGTEGQGMPGYQSKYSLIAGALNFGIELTYSIHPRWQLFIQYLQRKTNTDYLDDISGNYVDYNLLLQLNGMMAAEFGNKLKAPQGSQRGNPVDNDWYQSFCVGLNYTLYQKKAIFENKKHKPSVLCPKF